MKKNVFIAFFVLFSFTNGFAQNWGYPKLDLGIAFRFEPWVLEDKYFTNYPYGGYYPFQEKKARVFLNIKEKIPGKNNLSISLSNYITRFNIKSNSTDGTKDFRFKRDHFIDITNSFKSKKQRPHFILGIGAGLMNCGTVYGINRFGELSQRFFAPRLIIGAQKERISASAILHGTPDREGDPYPTIWAEIRLAYTINPFSKMKKL